MQIHNISEADLLDDDDSVMVTKQPNTKQNADETDAAMALAQLQRSSATQKFVPKFSSNVHQCGLSKAKKQSGTGVYCVYCRHCCTEENVAA